MSFFNFEFNLADSDTNDSDKKNYNKEETSFYHKDETNKYHRVETNTSENSLYHNNNNNNNNNNNDTLCSEVPMPLLSEGSIPFSDIIVGTKRFKKSISYSSTTTTTDSIDKESDLIPGSYGGGYKVWECSLDLVSYLGEDELLSRLSENCLDGGGVRVLELGCGVGVVVVYDICDYYDCDNNNNNNNNYYYYYQ